jgi:hypothetical protein
MMFGLVLASLAAGLVTVLFVNTPVDVLAEPFDRLPKTASATFDLALLAATHLGIFASVFVLIVAGLGEWFSVRALSFYLLAGVVIALFGFSAQYMSEVAGQPTILNNYAIKAFLTVGFFGGFFYWVAAGQFAGHSPENWRARSEPEPVETRPGAPEAGDDNSEVVITEPSAGRTYSRHRAPLLERLKFSKRRPSSEPSDDPESNPIDESHYSPGGDDVKSSSG